MLNHCVPKTSPPQTTLLVWPQISEPAGNGETLQIGLLGSAVLTILLVTKKNSHSWPRCTWNFTERNLEKFYKQLGLCKWPLSVCLVTLISCVVLLNNYLCGIGVNVYSVTYPGVLAGEAVLLLCCCSLLMYFSAYSFSGGLSMV